MHATYCYVLLLAVAHLLTDAGVRSQSDEDYDDRDYYREEFSDASSYTPCKCEGIWPCYCVQNRLCNPDGRINIDGRSLILPRVDFKVGQCNDAEICCASLINDIPRMFPKRSTTTTTPASTTTWPECGKRGHWPRANYGREDTKPEEFPWMAAILKYNESGNLDFQCGGSIVGPTFVLTAGHCIQGLNPGQLLIRAGAWNLSNESEEIQDLEVALIIRHPEYSFDPVRYDIALLVAGNEFRPGPRVSTVCLPKENMSFPSKEVCVATGWSTGKFGVQGALTGRLRRFQLPIVSHRICQKRLRKTYLGRWFALHKSFMCAGGEDEDTCTGDGGVPLVCEQDGSYHQVGISSWGVGCEVGKLPGVYANVTLARNWIQEQMEKYGKREHE